MAIPKINIKYQNGKLGTVEASKDGLLAICVKGAAVSTTFAQNKAYKIYQPSGLTALGVTATSHPLLVEAVKQFYNEAEEGTPVYVVAYSDSSMSDFLDKDEGSLKGILQSVKGDIRGVVVYHAGTEDPDTSEGLEADVFTAMTKAQALAEWTVNNLYAPVFVALDGFQYAGASDLRDLSALTNNRVCIVLGSVSSTDGHAAMGMFAGRVASSPVQRNIGCVADGPLSEENLFLGSNKVSDVMDDVTTIYDKGYITPRTYVGRSGYYYTDDSLATKVTDDYAHLTARRTIDKAVRIAYDTLLEKMLGEVEINDDGTMQESLLKSWQAEVEDDINANMTRNGELVSVDGSGCECFIDATQNVRATSNIDVVISVRPFGYARSISASFGFKVQ